MPNSSSNVWRANIRFGHTTNGNKIHPASERSEGLETDKMSAEDYVVKVIRGEIEGMTLAFQLKQGFRVLAVAPDYLPGDPESLGYGAIIEWINTKVAIPSDYGARDPKFDPTIPL